MHPWPDLSGIERGATGTRSRLGWMDASRGAAVLLVVIGHAVFWTADASPDALLWAVDFFRPFRIPTLLLLSGLLVERALAKSTRAYIDGKWRSIVWPLVVWNVIIWGIRTDPPSLFAPVTWLQPGHLWFLLYLVGYYLLALVLRGTHPSVALLLLAAGWTATYGDPADSEFFRYGIFFFVGTWLGVRSRGHLRPPRAGWTLVAGCLVAAGFGVAYARGMVDDRHPLSMSAAFAGIYSVIGLCAWFDRRHKLALLQWVGRNSLIFYVTHFPVVAIAAVAQKMLVPDFAAWHWATSLVLAVAVCSVAALLQSHRWAELPYRAPFGLVRSRSVAHSPAESVGLHAPAGSVS